MEPIPCKCHCWHEIRKEKHIFHTKDEHGPFNPDPNKAYTKDGVIYRCCHCAKEEWLMNRGGY